MALKTDTSVHSKNGLATALEAPGLAPALAAGVRAKKHAGARQTKAQALTDDTDLADTADEDGPSASTEQNQTDHLAHVPLAPLEENTVSLAALDPTWYAEPGSKPSATDASKSSWFAAPAVPEPVVTEPIATVVAYQTPTPTAPRAPALSPMGSNAMALGLGGLGLGLAAGGGGGGGGGSAAPAANTPNTPTSTIKVVDGPIRGASVYWDMNNNGKYDAGDTLVSDKKTGADGTLNIATSSLGQHGLLAVGGWNDNGAPNASTLSLAVLDDKSAPLLVVSPLTSLVSAVYLKSRVENANATFQTAESAVKAALGIDTGSASLSSLDPTRTDATGLQLLKAGAVLAGLAAVPQSITASGQDSLANYVLRHAPTGGALLTLLGSSEGLQTVFASNPSSLSATDEATLGLLAGNNARLMAASSAPSLSSTQIAKPQILGLEYDTGLSASDRITSLPQLRIASLGGTTELSVNNGATWVAADNFAPADGDITVRARSNYGTDSVGTLVTSGSSEAFTFKLQTTVPPAPTIGLASDTGISTADRLTNSSLAPVVSATTVNGSVLQYSLDGLQWSASLSPYQTTLAQDGAHTVYVRQILQDMGVASAVNRLDFTLDTRIAAGTAGVLGADDTGPLQDDGITTNSQPRLEGRTDPGNTVAFTLGEMAYSVVADRQGYWIFDTTVAAPDHSFEEGSTDIALTITDAAGNTADTPLKITVTVDTELDVGSAGLVDISDEATEIYNHTPTLRGTTTEIGAIVTVSLEVPDATGTTTETLFFNTTTVKGSDGLGYWSVVLDTPAHTGLVLPMDEDSVLMSYDYSPVVTITDLAGNSSEDTLRDFTLVPGPDAVGRLSSLDTGTFANDGITSHTPASFAGKATPGSVISLLIDDIAVAENIIADTQTGDWNWTDQAPSRPDGLYAMSLEVVMESGVYAGKSQIILPSLTIDTTAPDATAIAGAEIQYSDRVAASTEGALYFNNLDATGDTVLTFSGAAAEEQDYGATLELHLVKVDAEGATVSDITLDTVALSTDDGSWSFEWNGLVNGLPAAEGSYFMRARATDVAGNRSTDLLPVALRDDVEQGFAVDNTAPTPVAGARSLDADSRTGSDPSYTNLTSPTLSGRVAYADLASVAITVDGATYGLDTDIAVTLDTETGDWSLTLEDLSDGLYNVSLSATDVAGNTSSPVALSRFTLDTLPEYYSGDPSSEDPTLESAWGAPVAMLTGTASTASLLVDLVGTVDPALTDNLPEGLSLSANGQLYGTPTTAGITWLTVYSYDLAGNESTTNVQLVVTTGESTKTTLNNSNDAAAKTYNGTTGVDTIKLTASNGDVVFALDGNDTINIANIVNDGDTKQLFARIDGGDGIDILNFQAKGESIDFSSFNSPDGSGAVIHGVEQLKFVGASGLDTSVTLSVADVFKLDSDAVDLDGNALLLLTAASSSSNTFLTATLTDFTQVGETNAYSSTGAEVAAAKVGLAANYSQFQGTYTDHLGAHDVTVLVQGYFILG